MTKQNPSGFFSGNNSRDDSTMLKVAKKRSYVLHKRRCIPNWMILTAVLTLFAVAFSVTVAVYNLSTPLKCYQCSWAATTLKPTPNSSCHLNQHKVRQLVNPLLIQYNYMKIFILFLFFFFLINETLKKMIDTRVFR